MERVRSARTLKHTFWILVCLLIAVPGCLDGALELGGSASAIPSNLGPDRSYRPEIGDRAVLYGDRKSVV